MDWIQGDKFEKIADLTFAPPQRSGGDYSQVPNTFNIEKCKQYDPCFVYTHTYYAKDLFNVIKYIKHRFVVITHNWDTNVDFLPPDNVVKWYTQNVNIIDSRIESIPIGLENDRWFKEVDKKGKMIAQLDSIRGYDKLVYMNFDIKTNPLKRNRVYQALKDKTWVTVDMHSNGYNFEDYIKKIHSHRFVICPEGNGIDTHRMWESLYMKAYPIVDNNINNSFYKDLPILAVDNWEDLTLDFIIDSCRMLNTGKWNYDKLTFEYWKNKIRNEWI